MSLASRVGNLLANKLRTLSIRSGRTPLDLGLAFTRKDFVSWHTRPAFPSNLPGFSSKRDGGDFAIVMQGPIIPRKQLTFESLKTYRRLFPKSQIVFSTWATENHGDLNAISALGVTVVTSSKPLIPGPSNINFQIRSSKAGLNSVQGKSIKYAIKVRSDQRFYSRDALHLVRGLLLSFRASDGKDRFGAISLDSFVQRLFGLSDMMQFSSLGEMRKFWSLEEVPDELPTEIDLEPSIVESYLYWHYAQKRGAFEASAEGWQKALRDIFIVADASSFDLLWQKYSRREYLWRRYENDGHLEELTFASWLRHYRAGGLVQ